jgi:hypothetical protein
MPKHEWRRQEDFTRDPIAKARRAADRRQWFGSERTLKGQVFLNARHERAVAWKVGGGPDVDARCAPRSRAGVPRQKITNRLQEP